MEKEQCWPRPRAFSSRCVPDRRYFVRLELGATWPPLTRVQFPVGSHLKWTFEVSFCQVIALLSLAVGAEAVVSPSSVSIVLVKSSEVATVTSPSTVNANVSAAWSSSGAPILGGNWTGILAARGACRLSPACIVRRAKCGLSAVSSSPDKFSWATVTVSAADVSAGAGF
jgi:hypothetical protein